MKTMHMEEAALTMDLNAIAKLVGADHMVRVDLSGLDMSERSTSSETCATVRPARG